MRRLIITTVSGPFSDVLRGIFQPVIANINDLVKAQVDSVRIKRMEENHESGRDIKVCPILFDIYRFDSILGLTKSRQFFWLVALDQVFTCGNIFRSSIPISQSYNIRMRE